MIKLIGPEVASQSPQLYTPLRMAAVVVVVVNES